MFLLTPLTRFRGSSWWKFICRRSIKYCFSRRLRPINIRKKRHTKWDVQLEMEVLPAIGLPFDFASWSLPSLNTWTWTKTEGSFQCTFSQGNLQACYGSMSFIQEVIYESAGTMVYVNGMSSQQMNLISSTKMPTRNKHETSRTLGIDAHRLNESLWVDPQPCGIIIDQTKINREKPIPEAKTPIRSTMIQLDWCDMLTKQHRGKPRYKLKNPCSRRMAPKTCQTPRKRRCFLWSAAKQV